MEDVAALTRLNPHEQVSGPAYPNLQIEPLREALEYLLYY